jgi:hypothetical protein
LLTPAELFSNETYTHNVCSTGNRCLIMVIGLGRLPTRSRLNSKKNKGVAGPSIN